MSPLAWWQPPLLQVSQAQSDPLRYPHPVAGQMGSDQDSPISQNAMGFLKTLRRTINHVEQVDHQHRVKDSSGKRSTGTISLLDPRSWECSQSILCSFQHGIGEVRGNKVLRIARDYPCPVSGPTSELHNLAKTALFEQSPLDCL